MEGDPLQVSFLSSFDDFKEMQTSIPILNLGFNIDLVNKKPPKARQSTIELSLIHTKTFDFFVKLLKVNNSIVNRHRTYFG